MSREAMCTSTGTKEKIENQRALYVNLMKQEQKQGFSDSEV